MTAPVTPADRLAALLALAHATPPVSERVIADVAQAIADARESAASAERVRIQKAQEPALRNLRVLMMPECSDENVNGERLGACVPRHADDCPKGMMLEALRWLRAATRRPK